MPIDASTWTATPLEHELARRSDVAEPARRSRARPRRRAAAHEDRELVAAEPREQVLVAHVRPKRWATWQQQLVAALMAQDVVDLLEAVEVEEQQSEAVVEADGAASSRAELFVEAAAVGQPGQLVVQRAMAVLVGLAAQRGLEVLALGERGARPPAAAPPACAAAR